MKVFLIDSIGTLNFRYGWSTCIIIHVTTGLWTHTDLLRIDCLQQSSASANAGAYFFGAESLWALGCGLSGRQYRAPCSWGALRHRRSRERGRIPQLMAQAHGAFPETFAYRKHRNFEFPLWMLDPHNHSRDNGFRPAQLLRIDCLQQSSASAIAGAYFWGTRCGLWVVGSRTGNTGPHVLGAR